MTLSDGKLSEVLGSPAEVGESWRFRVGLAAHGMDLDLRGRSTMSGRFSYEHMPAGLRGTTSDADIGQLSRALRNVRPSIVAVAMMAPVSLLVLYLWSTTPSASSPHGDARRRRGNAARPVVFLTAWMLMTAAMMLPSAMPLLVSLDRIARNQSSRHAIPVVAALAYLGIWGLVGVAALTTSAAAEAYLLPRASTQVVSGLAGGVSGPGGSVRALPVGRRLSAGLPPALRISGALLARRIQRACCRRPGLERRTESPVLDAASRCSASCSSWAWRTSPS